MNSERLIAYYERIADAPEAVGRLRRFILDLAANGQLLNDVVGALMEKPIEECLERLENGKRIQQGWSPQCESEPSPNDEVWGVLKTTAIQDGYFVDHHNKKLPGHLAPKPQLEIRHGDLLMTCAGPRARCGIACLVQTPRRKLMFSGKMYRFRADRSILHPEFLQLYLRSTEAQNAINAMKTGSSESGLNLTQDRFRKLKVRFGSLQHQQRTVAKVDELMSLCNQLQAARVERETVRDRLTAASHARLNEPDPETFECDVRFALDAMSAVTARPDQIGQLRQTILNLAVRGKLVPQDPTDEPAFDLLKRVATDKGITRGVESTIDQETAPYLIPKTWLWATLSEIITSGPRNGISPKPTARDDAPKAITLTATTGGKFDSAHYKHVEAILPHDSEYWLTDGDLLFQRGNTREYVGIAAIYKGPSNTFLFPDLIMKVRVSSLIDLQFAHLATVSAPARAYLSGRATGAQSTMPKINQATLLSLPIPVPPFAEQQRIVAKVDELMTLCDQLEASLTHIAATRSQLLEALVTEALEPAKHGER